MKRILTAAALCLLALWPLGANAQNTTAKVVATCGTGTRPTTSPAPIEMDQGGHLCTNASGGGGGGGAVTVADGADVALGTTTDSLNCASGTSLLACLRQLDLDARSAIPAGTNPIGTITGNVNVAPTDCSGTITSGGTAQAAIAATATIHGFTIANVDSAHGDEVLWISLTATAAAQTAASYPLPPPTATTFAGFGSYTTPLGFGSNHAVSIIGATTGHVFSCTVW